SHVQSCPVAMSLTLLWCTFHQRVSPAYTTSAQGATRYASLTAITRHRPASRASRTVRICLRVRLGPPPMHTAALSLQSFSSQCIKQLHKPHPVVLLAPDLDDGSTAAAPGDANKHRPAPGLCPDPDLGALGTLDGALS